MTKNQKNLRRKKTSVPYKPNRKYKDCLFRLIFQEKEDLLDLYNAVNKSDYQNPEELTIYTLDDAVYICMKNDLSFLIGEMLNLYEHQSTVNPNMPMRGFLYFARNYEAYIEQNKLDIYSSVLQKVPLPQYFIFYNGPENEPDIQPLELTDAFPEIKGKEPYLNCTATMLNINYGHNSRLMERCRKLKEYAILVDRIRNSLASGQDRTEAINRAVDSCIDDDILREFLLKHRGEVRNVVLSSFDQENHDRILKEEYIKIGQQQGIEIGQQQERKLIKKVYKMNEEGKTENEIADECGISPDEVREILA
jgi:hypothetical protein